MSDHLLINVSGQGDRKQIVSPQGKKYIITLFSNDVTSGQVSLVASLAHACGLDVAQITPLSESSPSNDGVHSAIDCLEFSAQGVSPDLDRLHRDILRLSSELGIDVVFQEDTVFRRHRRLIAFDMDSTLIQAEVIDLLAETAGVGDRVAAITERAMQGELDFNDSFRQRLAMLKGLDEFVLADIAKRLPVTEGTELLIKTLKALGYKTAILSGGFSYFAHYLQQLLGIDYVFANELEIVHGKITGVVNCDIIDAPRKAELLKDIARKEEVDLKQVIAVGDGANDVLMLNTAGLGIAFRAKPLVKEKVKHSISAFGLDSILYLSGLSQQDIQALNHCGAQ